MSDSIKFNFKVKADDVIYVNPKSKKISLTPKRGYHSLIVKSIISRYSIAFNDHRYAVRGGNFYFPFPDSYYREPTADFNLDDLVIHMDGSTYDEPYDVDGNEVDGVITDFDREISRQLNSKHWKYLEVAPDFTHSFYEQVQVGFMDVIGKVTFEKLSKLFNLKKSADDDLYFGEYNGVKVGVLMLADSISSRNCPQLIVGIDGKLELDKLCISSVGYPPYPRFTDLLKLI